MSMLSVVHYCENVYTTKGAPYWCLCYLLFIIVRIVCTTMKHSTGVFVICSSLL